MSDTYESEDILALESQEPPQTSQQESTYSSSGSSKKESDHNLDERQSAVSARSTQESTGELDELGETEDSQVGGLSDATTALVSDTDYQQYPQMCNGKQHSTCSADDESRRMDRTVEVAVHSTSFEAKEGSSQATLSSLSPTSTCSESSKWLSHRNELSDSKKTKRKDDQNSDSSSDSAPETGTPSETIGVLQLSGKSQPLKEAFDTISDEDECSLIPPSPESIRRTPLIIPSTPSEEIDVEGSFSQSQICDSQEDKSEKDSESMIVAPKQVQTVSDKTTPEMKQVFCQSTSKAEHKIRSAMKITEAELDKEVELSPIKKMSPLERTFKASGIPSSSVARKIQFGSDNSQVPLKSKQDISQQEKNKAIEQKSENVDVGSQEQESMEIEEKTEDATIEEEKSLPCEEENSDVLDSSKFKEDTSTGFSLQPGGDSESCPLLLRYSPESESLQAASQRDLGSEENEKLDKGDIEQIKEILDISSSKYPHSEDIFNPTTSESKSHQLSSEMLELEKPSKRDDPACDDSNIKSVTKKATEEEELKEIDKKKDEEISSSEKLPSLQQAATDSETIDDQSVANKKKALKRPHGAGDSEDESASKHFPRLQSTASKAVQTLKTPTRNQSIQVDYDDHGPPPKKLCLDDKDVQAGETQILEEDPLNQEPITKRITTTVITQRTVVEEIIIKGKIVVTNLKETGDPEIREFVHEEKSPQSESCSRNASLTSGSLADISSLGKSSSSSNLSKRLSLGSLISGSSGSLSDLRNNTRASSLPRSTPSQMHSSSSKSSVSSALEFLAPLKYSLRNKASSSSSLDHTLLTGIESSKKRKSPPGSDNEHSPTGHVRKTKRMDKSVSELPERSKENLESISQDEIDIDDLTLGQLKRDNLLQSGVTEKPARTRKGAKGKRNIKTPIKAGASETKSSTKSSKTSETSSTEKDPEERLPPIQCTAWDVTDCTKVSHILGIGMRVIAKWRDGYYYPGEIVEQEGPMCWIISYDDGDRRPVSETDIIAIEALPVGLSVYAKTQDDYFDSGFIVSHYRNEYEVGYVIELDSGATKQVPRSNVILTFDQACCLIGESSHMKPRKADISLDNIVEGRRRTSDIIGHEFSPTVKRSGGKLQKKKIDANLDTTHSESSLELSACSTETGVISPVSPKQRRKTAKSPKTTPKGSIKKGLKGSPRKGKQLTPKKESATKEIGIQAGPMCNISNLGPIPPPGSSLFKGKAFLLSTAEKKLEIITKVDDDDDDEDSPLSTYSSKGDDMPKIPFNKQYISAQIEAGGGTVLKNFNETQLSSTGECFLIADTYLRTAKYIQCLAVGIPCVSHLWIINSCEKNTLFKFHSYLLPSGFSILTNEVVEWHNRKNILEGLTVHLISLDNQDFLEIWTPVLLTAKVTMVTRHSSMSTLQSANLNHVDVIVTDSSCPDFVIEKAKKSSIPVVSTEWIIQSLINGRRVPFDSHPKFTHDFNA